MQSLSDGSLVCFLGIFFALNRRWIEFLLVRAVPLPIKLMHWSMASPGIVEVPTLVRLGGNAESKAQRA